CQRFVGDAMFAVIQMQAGCIQAVALAALRVLGEQPAHRHCTDVGMMRREPAPGFSVGERRHESAPRLARTVTRARDAARKSGAASAIEDIAFAVARSAAFPDALPGPARRGVAFART